jgi:hypothetical protein
MAGAALVISSLGQNIVRSREIRGANIPAACSLAARM